MAMNQGASQALAPNVLAQLDTVTNLGQRLSTHADWAKVGKARRAITLADKAALGRLIEKFDGANAGMTFNFEVKDGVVYADTPGQVNKAVNILIALGQLCDATENICVANAMRYDEEALITSGFMGILVNYARAPTCNNVIAGQLKKALEPIAAG